MDPSEFENTVEKTENALNAGIFEEFIHGHQAEKFAPFDIVKEVGDIYLTLYNCQESLKRFPQNDQIEDYWQALDDSAMKVAEMKEEYIQRRKKLSTTIKKFLTESLPKLTSHEESESSNMLDGIQTEMRQVIDTFKKEYDHLSSFAKFSEAAFLSLYKDSREYLVESKLALEQSVSLCLSTKDACQRAADQFKIAETLLATIGDRGPTGSHTSAGNPSGTSNTMTAAIEPMNIGLSASLSESERLQQKYQEDLAHELHTLRLQYDSELIDLKATYERQLQAQELSLQESLQQRHLLSMQQLEDSLHAKDQEIASLMQSLTNMQAQFLQSNNAQEMYENEQRRRQASDDKVRQLVLDMGNLESLHARLQKELDTRDQDLRQVQQQLMLLQEQHTNQRSQSEATMDQLRQKVHQLEMERLASPPKQLQDFAAKIGYFPTQAAWNTTITEDPASSVPSSSPPPSLSDTATVTAALRFVRWEDIETFILERLQRLDQEVTTFRRQEQQRGQQHQDMQAQLDTWKRMVHDKEQELQQLEKDLMMTQQQLFAKPPLSSSATPAAATAAAAASTTVTSARTRTKLMNSIDSAVDGVDSEGRDLEALLTSPTAVNVSSTGPSTTITATNEHNSNKIVQESLVKQRDRFLKARRELEEQVRQYRQKEDTWQQEMDKLTQENVLLYERVTQMQQETAMSSSSGSSSSSAATSVQRRGGPGGGGVGVNTVLPSVGVDLEQRLPPASQQQQQQHLTDLDKRYSTLAQAHYATRLIPGQQWWATLLRALFTDPYTRHAVFLYLFLLHCCATMYIWQILTPQLQEEIEAQQKEKWNLETLSQADWHPDIHES